MIVHLTGHVDRLKSKKVELLARVFDHAGKKFIRGFWLLSYYWSDGISLLPLDFALLASVVYTGMHL